MSELKKDQLIKCGEYSGYPNTTEWMDGKVVVYCPECLEANLDEK